MQILYQMCVTTYSVRMSIIIGLIFGLIFRLIFLVFSIIKYFVTLFTKFNSSNEQVIDVSHAI